MPEPKVAAGAASVFGAVVEGAAVKENPAEAGGARVAAAPNEGAAENAEIDEEALVVS